MEEDKPFFFPFPSIREGQREFMEDVKQAVEGGNILAAHAPTGIGKTVAVLVPALQYAIQNDKTVFFLTSKRSQHKIAIDTLRLIKEHAKLNFVVVDIISKQSMCPRAKAGSIYVSSTRYSVNFAGPSRRTEDAVISLIVMKKRSGV
jgi:Rad3-related DNA helicase